MSYQSNFDDFNDWITELFPDQSEYLQATREIARDVVDIYNAHEPYKKNDVLRRLSMPERIIHFSV